MKTIKQFMLLLMMVSLVTLSGCSNDDDTSGGDQGAASGTLTAKIDGASFTSLSISSSATLANGGQNLIIIASSSSGQAFSMTVLGYNGPGTYPLGGGANITNSASYSVTDVSNPQSPTTEIWQAPYNDTEVGSITITEETDANLKGNFNFTCKNVGGDDSIKTITDGGFNLTLQIL